VGSTITMVNITSRFIASILFLVIFVAPVYVHAGFFGDITCAITGLSCPVHVEAEEVQINSQNMALLQATISPDPNASSTDDNPIIVGGNSLASDVQVYQDLKNTNQDQISLYVVHSGDNLPAIAKMFGVSVNTIRWGNDIKGNTITPGQTLVIMPISGIQHTVKSGDTLQSIAKQHKGDLDEIMQYNNLTKGTKLAVGDVIFVPDGEAVATPASTGSSNKGRTSPSVPVYDGYYMRPLIGGVKTQGVHGHNGVDLASSYGAKIYASADGEVLISRSSGWNGGYGLYVVIKHNNGTQTLYGHLSGTEVSAGDHVTQGQVIGRMGSTGKSTGVHLHFEIRGARNPF
jgi:LysM repeat protein